jgi:6-phosphogluconolactonase
MEAEVIYPGNFVAEATSFIAERILAKQAGGGVFRLSLCGGSTPAPIYAGLAAWPGIDWERVMLTFGDERPVPPDHAQSNYRMVKDALLDPSGIRPANVLRICGELPPAEAAEHCEAHLRKLAKLAGEPFFVHDLTLLGMGDDGHTASLFPGTAALEEQERWVIENHVPQLDTWRITFTYPLIAASSEVLFLVNGANKHARAREVLAGTPAFPASAITAGKVWWMIGG